MCILQLICAKFSIDITHLSSSPKNDSERMLVTVREQCPNAEFFLVRICDAKFVALV